MHGILPWSMRMSRPTPQKSLMVRTVLIPYYFRNISDKLSASPNLQLCHDKGWGLGRLSQSIFLPSCKYRVFNFVCSYMHLWTWTFLFLNLSWMWGLHTHDLSFKREAAQSFQLEKICLCKHCQEMFICRFVRCISISRSILVSEWIEEGGLFERSNKAL